MEHEGKYITSVVAPKKMCLIHGGIASGSVDNKRIDEENFKAHYLLDPNGDLAED